VYNPKPLRQVLFEGLPLTAAILMKLPALALATIETALNKIIADQPDIVRPVLHNRCVCLHLDGIGVILFLRFTEQSVFVFDEWDQPADATIKGTPVALAAAGMSGRATTHDIQLEGDLQVAQAFENLLKQIDIDWEEMISHYTGDAIANHLGNLARGFMHWSRQSANAFADDLRDYLQIEARHLPLPREVEQFNNAVDDLRASVERFEMRVQKLESRRAAELADSSQ
jgi:ubiquinone biosynthesis protein UbiJ